MIKLPQCMRYFCLAACICSLAALGACTQNVSISHSPLDNNLRVDDNFATKVLVLVPPDRLQKHQVQSGLFAVGLLNSWELDVSSHLADAVADVFAQHYDNVVVVKDLNGTCDDCGMVVRPRLIDLEVNKVSMQSSLGLELQIFDGYGNPITTLTSTGASPFFSMARAGMVTAGYFVPFVGTLLGEHVVRSTLQSALDKALLDTGKQLEAQADGGVLARAWRPKKTQYGQHEYAAEVVARREGCDLRTDGIILKAQEYSKEIYSAYCWGRKPFTISCEYGQCQAEVSPQIAAQQDPVQAAN